MLKREWQQRKVIHFHLIAWLAGSFNLENLFHQERKRYETEEVEKMADI
jgi:hypothetical protein